MEYIFLLSGSLTFVSETRDSCVNISGLKLQQQTEVEVYVHAFNQTIATIQSRDTQTCVNICEPEFQQ